MKEVAIIMGSRSDYETMVHCQNVLDNFQVSYDTLVVSAHRTPKQMMTFAESAKNQYQVIIAAAGGAAHLPGMVAALTTLPVIGVPIQSAALSGMDSLLSIVQMPQGVPVLTMAIGKSGAINAAYSAISILALNKPTLAQSYQDYKHKIAEDTWKQQLK